MKILLIISSSVGCYKALDLVREFQKQDIKYEIIATKNTFEFISPLLLESISRPHPPHLPQERTGANDDDDQSYVDIKAVPILHSNQAGFRGLSCTGKRWQCKVEKYDKQTGAYKEVSLCQSIPHDSPKVSSPIPIPSYHCCLSFPSTATATGSPPRSVGGVAVKG